MTGASHPWGIDRSSLLITISCYRRDMVVGVVVRTISVLAWDGDSDRDVKAGADVTLGT